MTDRAMTEIEWLEALYEQQGIELAAAVREFARTVFDMIEMAEKLDIHPSAKVKVRQMLNDILDVVAANPDGLDSIKKAVDQEFDRVESLIIRELNFAHETRLASLRR